MKVSDGDTGKSNSESSRFVNFMRRAPRHIAHSFN